MKKICLLLLMSVLFVFTACGSSNEKESEEEKTIYGKWTEATYYTKKKGENKYKSDNPLEFVTTIYEEQSIYQDSSLPISKGFSGSWSKTDEDDTYEYYTIYVDGNALAEMEFDKIEGTLLIKSIKNNFSVYYGEYSCCKK